MRFVCFLLVVIGVISCGKKEDNEGGKYPIHIISKHLRENKELQERYAKGDTSVNPPPRMPEYLYGSDNFILDDSLNLFYYKTEWVISFCGTGMENDTIPLYENIRPKDVIQIPESSIDSFVKLNLRKGERNLVKIASQKDTLNSNVFFKLQKALDKHLSFREDRDLYVAYRTTQEEDTVLYYKKNKKYYDSDSVRWDRRCIKFMKK